MTPADPASARRATLAGGDASTASPATRARDRDPRSHSSRRRRWGGARRCPIRACRHFGPTLPAMIELCDEALAEAAGDDARSARDSGLPEPRSTARGECPRQHSRTPGPHWRKPSGLAISACSPSRSREWDRRRRGRPRSRPVSSSGRGDRGEPGLVLEYLESPRVYLARLLMRLGELDRARAILEELEAQAAARGDEDKPHGSHLLPELGRVDLGPLAACPGVREHCA